MKEIKEIKKYLIEKEGAWCEVFKDGKLIYAGSVDEDMSLDEIYCCVATHVVFRLNGKTICSYSIATSFPGEKESTLELLASEHNCSVEDILVSKEIVD